MSDTSDFDIDAAIEGENADFWQERDGVEPARKRRPNLEDMIESGDESGMEDWVQAAKLVPKGSPQRLERIMRLLHEFERLHRGKLSRGRLAGRERQKKGLDGEAPFLDWLCKGFTDDL